MRTTNQRIAAIHVRGAINALTDACRELANTEHALQKDERFKDANVVFELRTRISIVRNRLLIAQTRLSFGEKLEDIL